MKKRVSLAWFRRDVRAAGVTAGGGLVVVERVLVRNKHGKW